MTAKTLSVLLVLAAVVTACINMDPSAATAGSAPLRYTWESEAVSPQDLGTWHQTMVAPIDPSGTYILICVSNPDPAGEIKEARLVIVNAGGEGILIEYSYMDGCELHVYRLDQESVCYKRHHPTADEMPWYARIHNLLTG